MCLPPISLVGNLHSETNINKLVNLGLKPKYEKILRNGLEVNFDNVAAVRKLGRRNNKSVRNEPAVVEQIIKSWAEKGYVTEIPREEAEVILPLTLNQRLIHSNYQYKWRLCLGKPLIHINLKLIQFF